VALFIGLILGWLTEWLIDWRVWRPQLAGAAPGEYAELRRQLAALRARPILRRRLMQPQATAAGTDKGN
jgi:hypothetical protein